MIVFDKLPRISIHQLWYSYIRGFWGTAWAPMPAYILVQQGNSQMKPWSLLAELDSITHECSSSQRSHSIITVSDYHPNLSRTLFGCCFPLTIIALPHDRLPSLRATLCFTTKNQVSCRCWSCRQPDSLYQLGKSILLAYMSDKTANTTSHSTINDLEKIDPKFQNRWAHASSICLNRSRWWEHTEHGRYFFRRCSRFNAHLENRHEIKYHYRIDSKAP